MDIREIINILDIYNKAETPDVYNRRSNNESRNIKIVVKAIQEQRFSVKSTKNLTDFLHLLKAADSISLDIGINYLKEFMNIPDVATIITERLTDERLKKMEEFANRQEENGQLPNFEKTVAEKDKEAANIYLSSKEMIGEKLPIEELKRFDKHISEILSDGKFAVKTSAAKIEDISQRANLILRLGRVMLRQRGMNPGPMKIQNNKAYFEMDVPEPEPIFHGLRQEQGISIAQQEQIKKEQEEKEQHQKRLEKTREKEEQQIDENNEYSIMAENKRKQEKEEQSSSFMAQKQKNKPEEQGSARNAFMSSVKYNVRQQNSQKFPRQTNSPTRDMGMSR